MLIKIKLTKQKSLDKTNLNTTNASKLRRFFQVLQKHFLSLKTTNVNEEDINLLFLCS